MHVAANDTCHFRFCFSSDASRRFLFQIGAFRDLVLTGSGWLRSSASFFLSVGSAPCLVETLRFLALPLRRLVREALAAAAAAVFA